MNSRSSTPDTDRQPAVTARQRQQFARDGFVVVRGLITGALLRSVQAGYRQAIAGRITAEVWADRYRLGALLQLPAPCLHIPQLQSRQHHRPIVAAAQTLMGEAIDFWYDQLIYKPAGNLHPTPWHQDAGYWQLPGLPALTCWLAVDDVDENMGCMEFVPGSHRDGVVAHCSVADRNPINNAQEAVDRPDRSIAVPLRAGDVTFHHACTLHYTAGNLSRRDRCGLVHHLADATFLHAHGQDCPKW